MSQTQEIVLNKYKDGNVNVQFPEGSQVGFSDLMDGMQYISTWINENKGIYKIQTIEHDEITKEEESFKSFTVVTSITISPRHDMPATFDDWKHLLSDGNISSNNGESVEIISVNEVA